MKKIQPNKSFQVDLQRFGKPYFFRNGLSRKKKTGSMAETETREKPERNLLCARCSNPITSENFKFEIQGGFQHTFLNPAGLVFEIGCFLEAKGCFVFGERSGEWTWFPGFSWQSAVCAQCTNHLGWFYDNEEGQSFFGLILENLIE